MMNYQDQIRNNEGMAEDMFDNYVSEQERRYEKRIELLKKFIDGHEKYKTIPLFTNVIDALVRGSEPFEIIEKLIEITEEQNKRMREWMANH